MVKFVDAIGRLTLEQWEELHTVTLDLSPLFVPYVGHVVWGENYRRGAFMADLARAQTAAGVDAAGELPDHLEPILRYLDAGPSPMSDLVEILPQALARMIGDLHSADAKNPYRHVLRAVSAVIDERVTAARSVTR
jgi:nitrate reductase delta subunit